MVKKEEFEGREAFACEACGFHYEYREDAEQCEEFCTEKGTCNSEVTSRSFERSG
jgi:hypothetical protein